MALFNIGAGPRIQQWRNSQTPRMTAQALADLLEISQGSLSDIENGNCNPSASTIVQFDKWTDIDLMWMITGRKKGENQ